MHTVVGPFRRTTFLLKTSVAAGMCLVIHSARSQVWSPATLPTNQWVSGASSADGTKLVAAGLGVIYTSTNSGSNWIMSLTNSLPWVAAASSWDGTKLVVAAGGYLHGDGVGTPVQGPIYISSDSGSNWAPAMAPTNYWKALASSTDGTRLIAAAGGNFIGVSAIYASVDSGSNWSPTSAPLEDWYSVASSADGSKLVAAGINAVYTSTDYGTNWLPAGGLPSKSWTYACSSLDGTRLAVAPNPGVIYTSSDSGLTWIKSGSSNLDWNALACSADGMRLAAGNWLNQGIYMSSDGGSNWLPTESAVGNWTALTGSADGGKWLGVDYTNSVFTLQTNVTPALSITGSGGNIVLSWLLPSEPFAVMANSDLNTTNWAAAGGTPMIDLTNLQYYLPVTTDSGSGFFRLMH
jgi:hypothetical protein